MNEELNIQIDENQALEIARKDALVAYRDVDHYEVIIELKDGNWQIDYELQDKEVHGGGPHYIISSETGRILSKRYEQ